MAKKAKARRNKATKKRASRTDRETKFELYLDSTYGLSRSQLSNTARSMGASKRKSKSMARKLRPKTRKEKKRNAY